MMCRVLQGILAGGRLQCILTRIGNVSLAIDALQAHQPHDTKQRSRGARMHWCYCVCEAEREEGLQ